MCTSCMPWCANGSWQTAWRSQCFPSPTQVPVSSTYWAIPKALIRILDPSLVNTLFIFALHVEYFSFISVLYMHVWCPQRSEDGVRSPGPGVTGNCELPCKSWELNLGPVSVLNRWAISPAPKYEYDKDNEIKFWICLLELFFIVHFMKGKQHKDL